MMSSEASTEGRPVPPKRESAEADSLQPWQLFTLAGLIGATIVVFLSRGQTPIGIILLSCAIFAAAFVGHAAMRTLLPLTGKVPDIRPEMLGGRTRAALERDKAIVLRAIKELEFDRGMGKVSEKDFAEMSGRLRARAARIMRQLDAASLYREAIEREVAQRVAATTPPAAPAAPDARDVPAYAACPSCTTQNDRDARFCKACGSKLGAS